MILTFLDGEEGANGLVLTRRKGRIGVDLVVGIALWSASERARSDLLRKRTFRLHIPLPTSVAATQPLSRSWKHVSAQVGLAADWPISPPCTTSAPRRRACRPSAYVDVPRVDLRPDLGVCDSAEGHGRDEEERGEGEHGWVMRVVEQGRGARGSEMITSAKQRRDEQDGNTTCGISSKLRASRHGCGGDTIGWSIDRRQPWAKPDRGQELFVCPATMLPSSSVVRRRADERSGGPRP
jgi:hypothetical protein